MRLAVPLVAAAVATAAAWPILGNYFYADDFVHLFEIVNYGLGSFLVAPHGGHMYLVRNLVFYAAFRAFDLQPFGYFALVLATHAVNAALLAVLVRRLTGDAWLALLGATVFAVSPANPGTLGWYSVHGHALAATATLVALCLVAGRPEDRDAAIPPRTAAGAAAAMLIASQCFGTGAAVALVLPVIALLLRPATWRVPASVAILVAVPPLVAGAWVALVATPSTLNPAGAEGARTFVTLASQFRAVAFMVLHLFGLGMHALVLGAAHPLSRYGDATSCAAIAVFVAGVVATLVVGPPPTRRALVACLLATATCYAAVAGARAALYEAVAREGLLRAYAEATRYQYLPQSLLAVALCLALRTIGRAAVASPVTPSGVAAVWTACAVVAAAAWSAPIDHGDADRAMVTAARHRLESALARRRPGWVTCLPFEPLPVAVGFPGSAGLYLVLHPDEDARGVVWFAAPAPVAEALRRSGGRIAGLVVPTGACPPQ